MVSQPPRRAPTWYSHDLCLRIQPYLAMLFFFIGTATTEIYTLSLHDALPIYCRSLSHPVNWDRRCGPRSSNRRTNGADRSEEHKSELQSHVNLVCRLLLE